MNFICLLFYFFMWLIEHLQLHVWLVLYLEGGQVDGEVGSLGVSSCSEHGTLILTGGR